MDNMSNFKKVLIVFAAFWALFYLLNILSSLLHPLMIILDQSFDLAIADKTEPERLRSEFTFYEQMSKYYLFIIILISIFSYRIQSELNKVKLSIGFLLFGLLLYLSESNMISTNLQPIFGIIMIAYIFILLLKERSAIVLLILLFGLALTSVGILSDFISENDKLFSMVPRKYLHTIIYKEERFDCIGLSLICISAIIYFLDDLHYLLKNNRKGALFILLSSAMITVGNGFLHYQYHPRNRVILPALILIITGYFGILLTNKYVSAKKYRVILITEEYFYFFLFLFFVALPLLFGNNNEAVSLFFWLPIFISSGIYLYFQHPAKQNAGINTKK